MKTIPPFHAVRGLVLFAALSFFSSPALFGQAFSVTPTGTAGSYRFLVSSLPALPLVDFSSAEPHYELYVHFGDGNFTRTRIYQTGTLGTGEFTFPNWDTIVNYVELGNYSPTVSLTGKYSPPDYPPEEFVAPPTSDNPTGPSASGTSYVMTGSIRQGGRDIGIDTSHRVPSMNGRSTTIALGWTRNADLPGKVALFFNGIRDGDNKLKANGGGANSMLAIQTVNRPHFFLGVPSAPASVPASPLFKNLELFYDSFMYIDSLGTDEPEEGRIFLKFRNQHDLIFKDSLVSILAVFITDNQARDQDYFKANRPDFDKIVALGLKTETSPNGGTFIVCGNGYLYDFAFYEERPVYIHDPNEIVITSMVKNGAGNFDMKLNFTSCSHYKSNATVTSAKVEIDFSALNSWTMTGVEQVPHRPEIEAFVENGANVPSKRRINKLHLDPGQCFTMHIEGELDFNKQELVKKVGGIFHGCVYLSGESATDKSDICHGNQPYDPKSPVPPDRSHEGGDPCAGPGFWNWLMCLCAQSPLPCWLVLILALLFLVWWFFKKKN